MSSPSRSYVAEDARELVVVDYEELQGVGNAEAALAEDAPLLYDGWSDNVAATYEPEIGDVEAAIADADVVVTERFDIGRLFACPLEGRGAVAEWDEGIGELTLWTSTQGPHIARDYLSWMLGLPEHRIRVLVPRIGGGFGGKFHFYPEETAVTLAAKATGRPVKWVEDRLESFVATVHAREQIVEATMAATADGRITGVKAELIGDQGAALHSTSYGPLWLTSIMMTNVYEIPNARSRARSVVTNKTPSGSYRGWGQPQANFVVERLVDHVARELGADPVELRRQNFIPPEHFPYTGLFHRFDSGRYAECLDRALELLDLAGWRRRQEEARSEGRHVGIGITFYVENTALGPSRKLNMGGVLAGGYDIGHVRIETNGEVIVYTGLCEMGQGFTNGLAQIVADNLGVHPRPGGGGDRRHALLPGYRLRHGRQPFGVGRRRRRDEGLAEAAREGARDRRAHARGAARRARGRERRALGARRARPQGDDGRHRAAPRTCGRSSSPRGWTRARGDRGSRPGVDGVALRRQRRRRRGRRRDRRGAVPRLRPRPRLRDDPQPDAGRGPDPRRRRAGDRRGALRGALATTPTATRSPGRSWTT